MSITKIYLCGILFTMVFCLRCNTPLIPRPFTYYLPTSEIIKVELTNVNGTFILNDKQLNKVKKDFELLSSEPGLHIKTGALMMILTLRDGNTFVMRGNSISKFLEVSSKIATQNKEELEESDWIVFKTNGINFNNYKKRN